jgi:Holliday junction resolvase RusA-like endonuclease
MAWRNAVVAEALPLFPKPLHEGPVSIRASFIMHRPKSLTRWKAAHHLAPPDLDKLIRATNDGLSGVAFKDDAQVWRLAVEKHYGGVGEETGAWITVELSEARPHADVIELPLEDWIANRPLSGDVVGVQ